MGNTELSSLHWTILGFLYAFFAQWSISPTKLNSYTIPPPFLIFKHSTIHVYAQKCFLAQRERVKLWSCPKKCYFYSPLYVFWLTMISQIRAQYTPLYKNEKSECKISQWRLLGLCYDPHRGVREMDYRESMSTFTYSFPLISFQCPIT